LFEECKKIAQNANIVFLGKKTNIVEYLKVADYFISASSSEGLPNSVLEAYMTGLPCILSDIPQHREIFQQNGQAVFFKTKNYNDLLNVLNCINFEITDTFPDFSATKMTRLYEEKYTTLINKFSPTK
jgi:glycosyltransferase involved in cell wall biosynthesis